MENTPRKRSLLGKFESKEEALKAINYIAKIFIIIGAIQIVGSYMVFESPFTNRVMLGFIGISVGVVYIVLALLLCKFKKMFIAIVILCVASIGVLISFMSLFGIIGNGQSRGIPIIGIAVVIACVQAIRATSTYNK